MSAELVDSTSPSRKRESCEKPVAEKTQSKRQAISSLQKLTAHTEVVVDSAKLSDAKKATDATTNPSLILAAAMAPESEAMVKEVVTKALASVSEEAGEEEKLRVVVQHLMAEFVKKISESVPGLVSFEVDPEYSFDSELTVKRAKELLEFFKTQNIPIERLLVKVAATWEGIQAAQKLEQENIHTNLTLLFSFCQAVACADAKAYLISPFVGRITDWYCEHNAKSQNRPIGDIKKEYEQAPETDPGVLAVRRIYNFYKKNDVPTLVMGASFRNAGQVKSLCGCDKLTIPPSIINALDAEVDDGTLELALSKDSAADKCLDDVKRPMDEQTFRWSLNEDQMATEKLSEGIRKFNADWVKLKTFIKEKYFTA
ncbi:transaldolase [Gregarina niphandrodes]|uniref:Transaldolase n=1 Tax=Gregarina niphandrodes TaxID=110365 RepID=A0A023B8M2_GRENI|nr:transaldolase [Gregarina niphandrodes]EZG69561.1 transaldolase [Gregarina niphandrodes]|eukprot:XP_011130003.1 transaldolase [Gregarina niphandrodes]